MKSLRKHLKNLLSIFLRFFTTIIFPFSYLRILLSNNKEIHILTYHRVCPLPKEKKIEYYNVSPKLFEKQMTYLSRHRFNVITLEEFINIKKNSFQLPDKSIIITFDDGFRDNYLYAFPILKKFSFRANFFVVSDYIGSQSPFPWLKWDSQAISHYKQNKSYWLPLNKKEIIKLSDFGHKINSHSKKHRALNTLDNIQAKDETQASRYAIEKLLSKSIKCFSYPYGSWSDISEKVKTLVKKSGYKIAVTSIIGSNTIHSDLYSLRRIPIYETDSLFEFTKKIYGAYDWLRPFQYVWLKFFPKKVKKNEKKVEQKII